LKSLIATYKIGIFACLLLLLPLGASAQTETKVRELVDSVRVEAPESADSVGVSTFAEVEGEKVIYADSLQTLKGKTIKPGRDWSTWKPDPKRAMWLALVFPGAGQMYNRKYWKLPIFVGGFVGCAYAYSWNGQMYKDYKQAYLDITDDDPNTKSYEKFLHLGKVIDESNIARYQKLFSQRKDRFRRYRDMSFFCILGVYALSVIDAYVDASLSQFDISDDLSLRVEPAYINNGTNNNPLKSGGMGVQCSLTF